MQIQLIESPKLTTSASKDTWLNFTFVKPNQAPPLNWLDVKERNWLQGKSTKRGTTFIWSRALLRHLCCEKLHVTAEKVEISLPAEAKTTLLVDGKTIYCSISHSKELVAVMISTTSEVGLDVEWISDTRDKIEYAELFPALLNHCNSSTLFYQRWTALEATIKVNGGELFGILAQQNPTFASVLLHWQYQNYQFCIASTCALKSCIIEQIDFQVVDNETSRSMQFLQTPIGHL